MIDIYSEASFKVLSFTDSAASQKILANNIESENIHLIRIKSIKELEEHLDSTIVLITYIKNKAIFKKLSEFIEKYKKKQYIISCLDNEELLADAVKSRIDRIILEPFNFKEIRYKILEKNKLFSEKKEIFKIQTLEQKEFNKEYEKFIVNRKGHLINYADIYNNTISPNKSEILEFIEETLIYNDIKVKDPTIKSDIFKYIENLLMVSTHKENEELIKKTTNKLISFIDNKQIESIILNEVMVFVNYLLKLSHSKELWFSDFDENLKILFEFQKRMIGLHIKYKLRLDFSKKEEDIRTNSLHLLMTAVSHVQQNQLAPIALKCSKVNKLIGELDKDNISQAQKRKELIKKQGDLFTPYNKFIDSLSSLFCSFKSDEEVDNSKNMNYLKFILELVFFHGLNIKYSHISVNISIDHEYDVAEKTKVFLFENTFIGIIWAVIENAIEASCTDINVIIQKTESHVEVIVKNNGYKIEDSIKEHIFKNFFGTKNRSGLGLSISNNWLRNINNEIYLESSTEEETVFKIKIPITEEKK